MRVVAGTAGGRRLAGPTGPGLRPTSDRVRESMFNALYSLGAIEGAVVLDLFAGTGALGIEALSRGAERAVFVENSRSGADLVRQNVATCGMDDRAEVVVADGTSWARADRTEWDLVLLDPPYDFDSWPDLLDSVAGGAPGSVVVVESNHELDPGPRWNVESTRRHGSTVVMLMRPASEAGQPANQPTDPTGSHHK
ncbi:MAG: 16S rRNA (guanine(966)-N(2))-methyltransferase RsmD [Acidimicrobiales bacterium]|nr:16S rRNA (guanine(966)-N(2))-methyltransferase RsmD [Acidimicrobiales bacterium]MDP7209369.1 16S rRNA (guanine(966)-N(2))-methyltransferase RsmD [Acidimicrobiales bacterium]HJO98661.1 16S rRNA (guanine(966)-N(2))-methyltransferase RsmD [Acidimicrobiales bacterium]